MQRLGISDHMLRDIAKPLANAFGLEPENVLFDTDGNSHGPNEKYVRIPYGGVFYVGAFSPAERWYNGTVRDMNGKGIPASGRKVITGYFYLMDKKE